jgi:hypothetical protein
MFFKTTLSPNGSSRDKLVPDMITILRHKDIMPFFYLMLIPAFPSRT